MPPEVYQLDADLKPLACDTAMALKEGIYVIVAIFYPFSQFCEVNISLLSLQTQPNTAPNLFQRGVEYGKYVSVNFHTTNCRTENL